IPSGARCPPNGCSNWRRKKRSARIWNPKSYACEKIRAHTLSWKISRINGCRFEISPQSLPIRNSLLVGITNCAIPCARRRNWILENIVGAPPPPPPPNVPELKEAKEAKGSLRQRMEQHRENAMCASCHARMDSIGFGFENYDGVGKWREKDGEYPVDAGGKL